MLDVDKSGYLTRKDYDVGQRMIKLEMEPDPKLFALYCDATEEFCVSALGLTQGKRLTKEEYVKQAANAAESELEKRKRGEETLLGKVQNAYFDVIDKNHDGFVTLEEYKLTMKINGLDSEAAEAAFKLIDKNKNGKVERRELIEHQLNFWLKLDDEASKGMLGEAFEKK